MILLIAPLIGIASALLTILLTPTLQHYFWQRQKSVEQQLAVIEDLRALAAELQFLLLHHPEDIGNRREQLHTALFRTALSVKNLFSDAAWAEVQGALNVMESALQPPLLPEPSIPRYTRYNQLLTTIINAFMALNHDIGIPPPPPKQWVREHVWQPLRVLVRDHSPLYWREHGWPMLQRWGAQARTKIRQAETYERTMEGAIQPTVHDVSGSWKLLSSMLPFLHPSLRTALIEAADLNPDTKTSLRQIAQQMSYRLITDDASLDQLRVDPFFPGWALPPQRVAQEPPAP